MCALSCFLGRALVLAHSGSHTLLLFLWVAHSCMHVLSLTVSCILALSLPPPLHALGRMCVHVLSPCIACASLTAFCTPRVAHSLSVSGSCIVSLGCALLVIHALSGVCICSVGCILSHTLWILCSLPCVILSQSVAHALSRVYTLSAPWYTLG